MAFLQPVRKPLPLGLDPGMGLFRADDAAKVLSGQVFRGQIHKVDLHMCPRFLGNCVLREGESWIHFVSAISRKSRLYWDGVMPSDFLNTLVNTR